MSRFTLCHSPFMALQDIQLVNNPDQCIEAINKIAYSRQNPKFRSALLPGDLDSYQMVLNCVQKIVNDELRSDHRTTFNFVTLELAKIKDMVDLPVVREHCGTLNIALLNAILADSDKPPALLTIEVSVMDDKHEYWLLANYEAVKAVSLQYHHRTTFKGRTNYYQGGLNLI
ncbi:hypothetical protein [Photobacterium leiognathi]|uniref:hypothetical protein n=1 Tax=Photobacterium leiognathi TaxID=553611 RepID=UPI002981DF2A|nr:hypothetical protein [Photobacterium leiognathi]